MRMAVSLEDGLGLDGDRCMRETPTVPVVLYCTKIISMEHQMALCCLTEDFWGFSGNSRFKCCQIDLYGNLNCPYLDIKHSWEIFH